MPQNKPQGKSAAYWQKRFLDIEAASNAYGMETIRQIEPAFAAAQKQIQKEIEAWYGRYAKNNQVSMEIAKKQLSSKELKEFKWDVNEYIKYGRQNALDGNWMKELENASARFHISRLEALKIRTQQAAEVAFGNELDAIDKMARKVFTEDYYKSLFEMQKGFNIGWEIGQIDERKLNTLVKKPWAADGKNFSQRIWQQRSQLVSELHNQLTRTCILGKAPDDAIKAISKKFNTTQYQAGRLVMTEQAYFHSVAQKSAFEELEVEEFEIVATLDSHTSEICQEMDGKVFPMSQYEAGVTAPPFHVFCRTVTVPYFEDNFTGERAARGADGKTYYVPDNMTYKKWKQAMVGGDTSGLKVIDNIDDLKKQLAGKQDEFNALQQLIQANTDSKNEYLRGSYKYSQYINKSDKDLQAQEAILKDEEAKLDALYKEKLAAYEKYYDRPDRGTPERAEWDKWKADNNIDINDISDDLFYYEKKRDERTRELKTIEKFKDWKKQFKGKTEKDFTDEIDRLLSKQKPIKDEIDAIEAKIKEAEKLQAEAAFSNVSLQQIKDEIIAKHDTILKTAEQKKEFSDIIQNWEKDTTNLYNKMAENFATNHYYDKGTGWYSPWRKRVEMDLNRTPWDKAVGRNASGAWKTKFHEEMHQLDHMLAKQKSPFALIDGTTDQYNLMEFTSPRTAAGKKMIAAIDDDVLEIINTAVDWDNATNGSTIKKIKGLGRISSDAKSATIKYLKAKYPTAKDRALIDTVTDAIGMTTSGNLHPYSKGFWGHKLKYCKDNGKGGATSEAWANIAGFLLRGDTEALDAVKVLMPKTVETYTEIFKEVVDYAKSNTISY